MAGQIPIGKTGRIIEGQRYVGRFLRVEDDGHGNFIVITSTKRTFEHGELEDEVWDDWVRNENEASLNEYFAELGYVVEWLEDHDPNSVRPWDSVGTWTVEAEDAAVGRTPPFGRRFFAALFHEFPVLAGRATFMAWSEQPEDVYAFFDYPECEFGVQIDSVLEYVIVSVANRARGVRRLERGSGAARDGPCARDDPATRHLEIRADPGSV